MAKFLPIESVLRVCVVQQQLKRDRKCSAGSRFLLRLDFVCFTPCDKPRGVAIFKHVWNVQACLPIFFISTFLEPCKLEISQVAVAVAVAVVAVVVAYVVKIFFKCKTVFDLVCVIFAFFPDLFLALCSSLILISYVF